MTYTNHSFLVNMETAESLQRVVQPYNESPVLCAALQPQKWPWIHPLLRNLAAAWGPVEIMFLAMPDHVQASLLRKGRKFTELRSALSLSLTVWDREKSICRTVISFFFFFSSGERSRRGINIFLKMCWL